MPTRGWMWTFVIVRSVDAATSAISTRPAGLAVIAGLPAAPTRRLLPPGTHAVWRPSSSVGTKIIIGLSGLFLLLYLLIHVGGNLLVFFGPRVFNAYAYNMEVRNPTLPILEIVILVGFLVHIYKTITMYLANKAARPV